MRPASTKLGRRARGAWAWSAALLLLSALPAMLVVGMPGCSPKKHYKILSFFFDGVPDPNAPPSGAPGVAAAREGRNAPRVVMFAHKPFGDGECKACHASESGAFFGQGAVRPNICRDCHADVANAWPVMHGPVTANACTWCHTPHQSPLPDLLRMPTPAVCVQCHEQSTLSKEILEHLDPDSNCLTCHRGHGGNDRHFLRSADAAEAEDAGSGRAEP